MPEPVLSRVEGPALSRSECDGEALLGERDRQRQADVAQADHGANGRVVMNLGA